MPPIHTQTVWVKVNATVDAGIAEIVSLLSGINGLQTIGSCQGDGDRPAYVYLYYGDWQQISRFMFEGLAPKLELAGEDATVSVKIFNGSEPMGKIEFSREATKYIASAIREASIEYSKTTTD